MKNKTKSYLTRELPHMMCTADASAYTGVSQAVLRKLAHKNLVPSVTLAGSTRIYLYTDPLLNYLGLNN